MQANSAQPDAALFIDWENLKFGLASRGRCPNLTALWETVQEHGRIVIARAYADWEHPSHRLARDQSALYASGIEPVYVPSRGADGPVKNSVDVKLATDCVECCHARPTIQVYILVTGDADLIHLAHALQPHGKRVIVIGTSWSTSSRWVGCVDELIQYDVEVDPIEAHAARPPHADGLPDLEELFRRVAGIVEEQCSAGRVPLMSYLGYQLRRRLPGFHPSHYGYLKLKDLIREAERRNLVSICTVGLEDWVSLPGEAPFGAGGDEGDDYETGNGHEPPPGAGSPTAEGLEAALRDLVITADEIAHDARYDFMSLGFLKQCLYRKAIQGPELLPPGIRAGSEGLRQLRSSRHLQALIDEAQRRQWLVEGAPTRRLDSRSGTMSTVQTWLLNREARPVAEILGEREAAEEREAS